MSTIPGATHCTRQRRRDTCPSTQIVGAALYLLDRLLRVVWMALPRRTLVFRPKGPGLAHVRFHKNPITEWLGLHTVRAAAHALRAALTSAVRLQVGQYYFVNFPELSLWEWHPFSVSCGPRETSAELCIRALGDHTRVRTLASGSGGRGAPPACEASRGVPLRRL